jgi:tetratricopeptide (TPR) repeat protein
LFEPVVQDTRVLPPFRQIFPFLRLTALATPRRAATVALALLAVMGLLAGLLARDYDATRQRLALDEFLAGAREADAHPEDAADHYRAALALDRENPGYRRALAVAMLDLGRTAEAESHLMELLQRDPIDGEANLLRARVALRRGAIADAELFYQRAIYGRWTGDPVAERIAARFELVELLSRKGSRIEARAELLRLQAELPDAPVLQRELANRFLALGDPAQAAEILQRVLKAHPSDAASARTLTQALLAVGRFREARDAASHALALDPTDRVTRRQLDHINEALSLDPTVRGLSASTRLRRSGELLARVLQDVEACAGTAAAGSGPPIDWSGLRSRAQAALSAKPASRDPDDLDALTEQRLAIIEELWRLRVSRCGAADGPLAWIVERLGR